MQEAIEYGLIDHVLESTRDLPLGLIPRKPAEPSGSQVRAAGPCLLACEGRINPVGCSLHLMYMPRPELSMYLSDYRGDTLSS